MNKIVKPALVISAIVLIYFDLSSLFMLQTVNGATIFNTVFTHYIPAGLLIAVAALLYFFKSAKTKLWSVISAIVSALMAAVRLFALTLQAIYIGRGIGATGASEYFEIAKFAGELLILVGMFFLALYFIKGSFKKTALSFMLISVLTFLAYYIADVVFAVQAMNEAGYSGLASFLSECLTYNYVIGVILSAAYLVLFSTATGMLDKTSKKEN